MTKSINTQQKQDQSAKLAIAPPASLVRGSAVNPDTAQVADEQRRQTIAVVAYYRAERRGFCEGGELDDWLAAEAEVEGNCGGQKDSK